MAFFIPFVRLSTAIFCPTQNRFHEACAGSVTEASVVVREPTMPHKLDASDEAAFEKIATILRNPYTKLSLPRPFWHASEELLSSTSPRSKRNSSLPFFLSERSFCGSSRTSLDG